jgi:hypothetical protein
MTRFYTQAARLSGMAAFVCAVLAVLAHPGIGRADPIYDCVNACAAEFGGGTPGYYTCSGNCQASGGTCTGDDCSNGCVSSYPDCDGTCTASGKGICNGCKCSDYGADKLCTCKF